MERKMELAICPRDRPRKTPARTYLGLAATDVNKRINITLSFAKSIAEVTRAPCCV